MISALCTLFEGSYHFGLAALVNSLHRAGFRGEIFAGHRGPLPDWAAQARPIERPPWPSARIFAATPEIRIVFLEVVADAHLTNHKPRFMLELLDGPAREADALFYLDPDICVAQRWSYFEDWVGCGVALCEDLNSPLSAAHPRRIGWRRHYGRAGLALRFRGPEYVNGGFVGVARADRAFLDTWRDTLALMADEIGSLASAKIGGGAAFRSTGFADCFDCSDQDALNAAIEASPVEVSIVGQDAMGFRPGAALLPHAVGAGKPWQRAYLKSALAGVAPRQVDKAFWANARGPLVVHGARDLLLKQLDLTLAAAVGRLLRRS